MWNRYLIILLALFYGVASAQVSGLANKTIDGKTILKTGDTAGGSLAGTYPNPTLVDTRAYGEMYFYTASAGAPTALLIDVVNQYHGIALTATGTTVSGWTYKAGTAGIISAVADNGGGTILITTSAPHNLAVGDYVCQTGFATRTTYRGKYKVLTTPLTTTYTVTRNFQVASDTGAFQRSWSLRANAGSAGLYRISFTMSAQAVTGTTDFRFELNRNATDLDNIAAQNLYSNAARPASMVGIGLLTVADDDVIYMSVKNLTDSTDYSVWLANLSLNRL